MKRGTIEFILPWRGREPGQTDDKLDYGLMDALVRSHRARWVDSEPEERPKRKRRKRESKLDNSVHS